MYRDTISIEGLEIDCVVGVHRHERDAPQRLRVDVSLTLDTEVAGATERISRTVDYQQVSSQIVFILQSARFRLIETAARALARHLLAPPLPDELRPPVVSVDLCLSKPSALDGRAVPSLRISREASWAQPGREERFFGTVDVIHDSEGIGIQRLNLAPGAHLRLRSVGEMGDAVMILGDGLQCQGSVSPIGSIHRWSPDSPHIYGNPTGRTQSILLVTVGAGAGQILGDSLGDASAAG